MTDQYFSRTAISSQVSLSVSLSLMKTSMLRLLLEKGDLQPKRQQFQLKKKMLQFFFFVEFEVAARICFLGELKAPSYEMLIAFSFRSFSDLAFCNCIT